MLLCLLEIHLDSPTKRIDLQHFAHPKPRVSAQKQCPVLLPNLRLPRLVHTTNEQQLNRLPVRPLPATLRHLQLHLDRNRPPRHPSDLPPPPLDRLGIYLLRIQKLLLSTRRPHPILHRPLLHPQHRTYTNLIRRPNHRLRTKPRIGHQVVRVHTAALRSSHHPDAHLRLALSRRLPVPAGRDTTTVLVRTIERLRLRPTHVELRVQWQERIVRGQPQRQYLLPHHVPVCHMVIMTGNALHLLAAPSLDGVVQDKCLHTTVAQSLLPVDLLRRAHVELAPIDILTFQEIIQDVLLRTAEHAEGVATKHRDRGDVQPFPHHEHEYRLRDFNPMTLAEARAQEQLVETQRLPCRSKEVVDVVVSVGEDSPDQRWQRGVLCVMIHMGLPCFGVWCQRPTS